MCAHGQFAGIAGRLQADSSSMVQSTLHPEPLALSILHPDARRWHRRLGLADSCPSQRDGGGVVAEWVKSDMAWSR